MCHGYNKGKYGVDLLTHRRGLLREPGTQYSDGSAQEVLNAAIIHCIGVGGENDVGKVVEKF
jgi:hypothetical protein